MSFNLGEGEGGNFTPCCFSPNNSEMVKDLILPSFANHQKLPCQLWYLLLTLVPKYLTNFRWGSFYYNFGTSNNIDMNFEPRSKLNKRNTRNSKKIDSDVDKL